MCLLVKSEKRKETASWYEALHQMFSTGTMEKTYTIKNKRINLKVNNLREKQIYLKFETS